MTRKAKIALQPYQDRNKKLKIGNITASQAVIFFEKDRYINYWPVNFVKKERLLEESQNPAREPL